MVVIRLARGGAKKKPFYHVVAADRRNPRDGRYIERLGYFNPLARGQESRLELQEERVNYWIKQGAQPSERVMSLLKSLKNPEANKAAPSKAEMRKAQAAESAEQAKKKLADEKKAAEEAAKAEAAEKKAAEEAAKAEAKAAAEATKEDAEAKAEDTPAEGEKPAE